MTITTKAELDTSIGVERMPSSLLEALRRLQSQAFHIGSMVQIEWAEDGERFELRFPFGYTHRIPVEREGRPTLFIVIDGGSITVGRYSLPEAPQRVSNWHPTKGFPMMPATPPHGLRFGRGVATYSPTHNYRDNDVTF